MNIIEIYNNYGIGYAHEGDRHYRNNWVNIPCPFCSGNPGNHLGFNLTEKYYACHRCGGHPIPKVLVKVLGISYHEVQKLIKSNTGKIQHKTKKIRIKRKNYKMPSLLVSVTNNKLAFNYLKKRGYTTKDIKTLEKVYDLQATGPVSFFEKMDLCYRLLAPIKHKGKMVSWQTRDLTNKSKAKYITCPKNREKMEHKHILYNAPDEQNIVLCEGIFDVWKVFLSGYPATCCFGVEYTNEQLKKLTYYENVYLFFDPDKPGKKQGKLLLNRLIFAGVNCTLIKTDNTKDPGDMTKKEIKQILTQYIRNK